MQLYFFPKKFVKNHFDISKQLYYTQLSKQKELEQINILKNS